MSGTIHPELIEECLDHVRNGGLVTPWCRDHGLKYNDLMRSARFHKMDHMFREARLDAADAYAEQALLCVLEQPRMIQTGKDQWKVDTGHVIWQRTRADFLLKLLGKWAPAQYGDKIGIMHEGAMSIEVVTGVQGIASNTPVTIECDPVQMQEPAVIPAIQALPYGGNG